MALLTIVFTDVVASSATKRDVSLGRDNKERDRAYLEKIQRRHFNLIREAYRAHDGREVSNMGDAFYLTFDDPVQAVRCAIRIQRQLAATPIETPIGPLRLRIGVHSGFPQAFEDGWQGTDVDTASRIESTATPHQILISARTYELVRHMTDTKFHHKGEFALKGVEPMSLWEVDWDERGPRPTAVRPIPSKGAETARRVGIIAGIAAVVLIAAGAAYHFYSLPESSPSAVESESSIAAAPVAEAPRATGQESSATAPATAKTDQLPTKSAKTDSPLPPAQPAPGPGAASQVVPNAAVVNASDRTIQYVPQSTIKVAQLIGEMDNERRQPTVSRTFSRYRLQGADQGSSFEHNGRAYFLFGDTIGREGRAVDTVGFTDARDPEAPIRLDFVTSGGPHEYIVIQPQGVSMGPNEIPVAGISLAGQVYVAVKTDFSATPTNDRSVLTKFVPPKNFQVLRTISQLPAGRFIRMSFQAEQGSPPGLPPGGPYVFIWGTGVARNSDAYLSIVPAANFDTGKGTRYFAGMNSSGAPTWSDREEEAKPVIANGSMAAVSVVWSKDLGLWLMLYERRAPTPGFAFSYSRTPWGPWSEEQIVFNFIRDRADRFIHNPRAATDDGLSGPTVGGGRRGKNSDVPGRAYAPAIVERWTKVIGGELNLHYVLSTWNPYVVVLMKSRLAVK